MAIEYVLELRRSESAQPFSMLASDDRAAHREGLGHIDQCALLVRTPRH